MLTRRTSTTRLIYRGLSLFGTAKAARRGPGALGRRIVRQRANRYGNRALRKMFRP